MAVATGNRAVNKTSLCSHKENARHTCNQRHLGPDSSWVTYWDVTVGIM